MRPLRSNLETHLRLDRALAGEALVRARRRSREARLDLIRRLPRDMPPEATHLDLTPEDIDAAPALRDAREALRRLSIAEGRAAMRLGEAETALEENRIDPHQ